MNGLTIALIVILVIIIILIIVLVPILVLGTFFANQIDDASRLYDGDKNKAQCFVEAVYKDDGITDSAKKAFPETLHNISIYTRSMTISQRKISMYIYKCLPAG